MILDATVRKVRELDRMSVECMVAVGVSATGERPLLRLTAVSLGGRGILDALFAGTSLKRTPDVRLVVWDSRPG